jgi:DUF2934 family protein
MAKASPARSRKTNGNGTAEATTTTAKKKTANLDEAIQRRAYELYEQEGRIHGRDQEHWLRAEAEVAGRRTA